MRVGELSAPFFIDVLAVKVLRQHSNEKLEIGLGKCLAHADSSSAIERHPSLWVPFLAVGSQAELVRVVESIGEEFGWLLPLLAVVMDTGDVVHNSVTFLQIPLANFEVLTYDDGSGLGTWRLET